MKINTLIPDLTFEILLTSQIIICICFIMNIQLNGSTHPQSSGANHAVTSQYKCIDLNKMSK